MSIFRCPRPECRAELSNRRIDFCPECHAIRPGSVRSQLMQERAPRLICHHCSTSEQPTLIYPKQVGDAYPLYHKGFLNVPDTCPNPYCRGKNPVQAPSGRSKFVNLLLVMGYWLLPLGGLLFIAFFGLPESLNAALDRLAAAPWWQRPLLPTPFIALSQLAATPEGRQFGVWAVKALFFYGIIGLSFWTTLGPRAQVTHKAASSLKGLVMMGCIIDVAFSLAFMLCFVFAPLVAFIPSTASVMTVPIVLGIIGSIAAYVGLLFLLNFVLPLLQLATFSLYGIEWEQFVRKCSQAVAFLHEVFGFNHEIAPLPQILVLLVSSLLIKAYGFGIGIAIVAVCGASIAIGTVVGELLAGLLIILPAVLYVIAKMLFDGTIQWVKEKITTWHSRFPKHP